MNVAPIDIAYEAGVPVVLFATRRAAAQIHPLAEDLIVEGAAVEVIAGVDGDHAVVEEALARVPEPRVLAVVCLAMERVPAGVRQRCDVCAGAQTRVVTCEIVPGLVRGAVGTIVEAMRAAQRDVAAEQHEGQALATVIADLRADGHDSCDDLPVVAPAPVIAADSRVPPPVRRRWPLAVLPVAAALALAVVLGGGPRPSPSPSLASPPPSAIAEAPPRIDGTSARRQPEFAAQGPSAPRVPAPPPPIDAVMAAPETPPSSPVAVARDDVLSQAIARGRVRRVDDLLVYPLAGERDWYAAMTSCRARAFWGIGGWRVPSIDELHRLARARLFAGAHAWSNTRAADREFALVMALAGGAVETANKAAETREVICVLQRTEAEP